MRILVTGHLGYIGTVLTPMLIDAGHEVVGLDSDLYEKCTFGAPPAVPAIADVEWLRTDVRDVTAEQLHGFDAVLHLAALSNDPLGDLDEDLTMAINHRASVRLARAGQGGRRRALRVLVLVQQLRRGRRRPARRVGGAQPGHARTAGPRCSPSATSPRSPTTGSARSSCATRRPTASRRGTASTSSLNNLTPGR